MLPLLLILLFTASQGWALTTSDCFDCHSDDTLTKEVGGIEVPLFINEQVYVKSIHGDMDCTDCHEDVADAEDEHSEVLEAVECGNCHDDLDDIMAMSVHHAEQAQVDQDLPACYDCHGKHNIMPATDSRSSTYDLNVPKTCCACHADEKLVSRHPALNSAVCGDYEEGMHGIVLIRSGLIFSAVCNDCHGSHDIKSPDDSRSLVNRMNINTTCSSCHKGIVDIYSNSIHGSLFEKGSEDAPTCVSCHGSHRVDRAMDKEFLVTVTKRCSGCHSESSDTYKNTYHGQVTGLGYTRAAQCPDCHGAHDILPQSDPASRINPANLVATCAACHPGAGINFTKYYPHADYHDAENYPWLYYIYFCMVMLLTSVFAFFGIHTLLWFMRAHKEERNRRP